MTQDRSADRPVDQPVDRTHGRTTRGLGAVLRVPGLPDAALPALLRHSAQDPYAVRLVLLLAPDEDALEGAGPESVEWLFSRSLLTDGLLAPCGEGDVRVRVLGREVAVELAGSASVLLPLEGLVEFLAASYDVVPTGAEDLDAAGLDAELARLLA